MHPNTERFLGYLLKGQNAHNKVLDRKLRYGRPSKMLDKEESKLEKYITALNKIKIDNKGNKHYHPLQRKLYDKT